MVDHIEETTVHFAKSADGSTPKPLKTDLHDLKYLSQLQGNDDGAPTPAYHLVTGRPCKDCLQDIGIYAFRASGGKPTAYIYPGKIFEPKTRQLVLESRAFYGRCLYREKNPVYVVFQREHVDRRRGMQSSVFVAQPGSDHMVERLIEARLPRVQDTLKLVKSKACREVPGRNRIMVSRPLNVDSRRLGAGSDDANDSDDTP